MAASIRFVNNERHVSMPRFCYIDGPKIESFVSSEDSKRYLWI